MKGDKERSPVPLAELLIGWMFIMSTPVAAPPSVAAAKAPVKWAWLAIAIAVALAYYIGFATPGWLRTTWQFA